MSVEKRLEWFSEEQRRWFRESYRRYASDGRIDRETTAAELASLAVIRDHLEREILMGGLFVPREGPDGERGRRINSELVESWVATMREFRLERRAAGLTVK